MFHIINFVESEKNGPVIPLYNVTDRLVKMLDISEKSVRRLKQELHQLKEKETNEKQRQETNQQQQQETIEQQQQEMKEQGETEANVRVLRRSNPPAKICCRLHTASAFSSSSKIDPSIPQALPPQKKRHSGHRKIILSEQGKDLIRVEFHKLIQEKVYPTSEKLLKRLNEQYEDFPIRSASTLRKEMKSIGFIYQRTSKIKIPLDSQAFVAARAKYFQALEELREANVHLYYHDGTWLNLREVKRLIWTLEGKGEIKKGGGNV
ncbi:unnamed protein product [Rotaria sp. Silwood2]|nr:unnamed protein product [Rotaria sp. Silwood2]